MKVLLEIEDDQAVHLMEVLKSLPYVKTQELTEGKAQLLGEVREAVENHGIADEAPLWSNSLQK